MHPSPASRIARRREAPAAAGPSLRAEPVTVAGLDEPGRVVAEVEARHESGRRRRLAESGKTRAGKLHREADQLFYKGDYESALVLYHRAAQIRPREPEHLAAARRAEAAIRADAEPRDIALQAGAPREPRSLGQEAAIVAAETAARQARAIVAEAEDPAQEIPKILEYFDARRDFWRLSATSLSPRRSGSRLMLKQLHRCVKSAVQEVETAYESGDGETLRRLSDELVGLASLTEDSERNQVDAYGYLAAKQLALGRHDRAADLAAKMFFRARTAGDVVAMVEALVTIGRVHLRFGHLHALARVWERLAGEIETEAVAQAWLYHDIGRCHLELGDAERALEFARLSHERARAAGGDEDVGGGGSRKWTLRSQLLSGQSLLQLGRYAEAVAALKLVAGIAVEAEGGEAERPILGYVQILIDQVICHLRKLNSRQRSWSAGGGREDVSEPTTLARRAEEAELMGAGDCGGATSREPSAMLEDDAPAFAAIPKEPSVGPDLQQQQQQQLNSMHLRNISAEDKIAQLLARTRAMSRAQSSMRSERRVVVPPMALPVCSSDDEEEEEENDNADEEELELCSSKTRVIGRAEPVDEARRSATMLDEDLVGAGLEEAAGTSDFERGAAASAARSDYDSPDVSAIGGAVIIEEVSDYRQPSLFWPTDSSLPRSRSFSLESETEPTGPPRDGVEQQTRPPSLSEYLRSLKSPDFDAMRRQDRLFLGRASGDRQ